MEEELCSYPSPWFMGCDPEDEHLASGGTRGIGSKDTEEVSRGRQLQREVSLLRQEQWGLEQGWHRMAFSHDFVCDCGKVIHLSEPPFPH